jgi:hypothetical protein
MPHRQKFRFAGGVTVCVLTVESRYAEATVRALT